MVAHAQFGQMSRKTRLENAITNACNLPTIEQFKCILDFWVTQWRRVRVSQDIVELMQKVKFFHLMDFLVHVKYGTCGLALYYGQSKIQLQNKARQRSQWCSWEFPGEIHLL